MPRIADALSPRQYQGTPVSEMATAAPPTYAQQAARIPGRVMDALRALGTGTTYGSAEPNNSISDLARARFWRGSVFGVPEDVQQRNVDRAMEAASIAAPIKRAFSAPQDVALRLAQERAALPVERGGLGLPPNNTSEQRAAAMGFDTPAYHGTHSDVPVFDRSKNVTAKDIYLSPNPSESGSYAEGAGGNVMPLLLRGGVKDLTQDSKYVENQLRKAYNAQVQASERKYYPFEQFKDSFMQGQLYQDTGGQSAQNALVSELIGNKKSILKIPDAVSGAGVGESYVIANPDNIRSRFAAFDPFRRNAAIAAAMGVAAPDLLAQERTKIKDLAKTK